MASNLNRVVLTGNLTHNPELRSTQSGASVCRLRVACNARRRGGDGQWADRPNYLDVTVWGAQADSCATYLEKGRAVAIDGRLEWRAWRDRAGVRRQAVSIVAESVQFLGGANGGRPKDDLAAEVGDLSGVPPAAADDEIPF